MTSHQFEFEMYRMNLVQEPPLLFEELNNPIDNDDKVLEVIRNAQLPEFKANFYGPRNSFEWALREFVQYYHMDNYRGPVYGITIAKSVTESIGEVVTDTGIEQDVSEPDPPLADIGRLFLYMRRHLMMVERRSAITGTNRWREALEKIIKESAQHLGYSGWIEFEPVPRHEEILEAFNSFQVLRKLRVILRLPNPDLSEHSRDLFDKMTDCRIREYLQEMKNPNGINKEVGKLPHASIEMAALGYKRDEVTMEGIRDNRSEEITTGSAAARGSINVSRDQIYEIRSIPDSPHAQQTIATMLEEVDRIIPTTREG